MKNTKLETENVIIIGGGPAGLSAAIYLARAGLKPLVFAGSPPGGQLTLTSEVENFPGYESIMGAELIEKMRTQAAKFGALIRDENVTSFEINKSDKLVNSLKTKSVIIATGAKAIWLGVPGEERLRGKGVSACATCDGFFFRGKTVAIVGGGDTALEEALTLTKFAKKVYVIHRRDSFRASKIMTERVLSHPQIEVVWNSQVIEINGEKRVEGVKIKSQILNSKSQTNLACRQAGPKSQFQNSKQFGVSDLGFRVLSLDGVFVAIGHKPDTELFKGKVEMDEKGYVITFEQAAVEAFKKHLIQSQITNDKSNSNIKLQKQDIYINNKTGNLDLIKNWKFEIKNYRSSTSVEGVFAAGDCVDKVYRQASTAAGMGVGASLDVERWLEE